MSYRASHDLTSKVVTGAVLVLLVVTGAVSHSPLAVGLSALVLVAALAWSPTGYSIADGDIVVSRLIGNVHIPLYKIREARAASADDFRGGIRLFGSGGLFGYYGIFRTPKLGKSTWYVTNRSHTVVLVSDSGTTILSPDDVDGFLGTIRKSTTISPSVPAMFASLQADGAGGRRPTL